MEHRSYTNNLGDDERSFQPRLVMGSFVSLGGLVVHISPSLRAQAAQPTVAKTAAAQARLNTPAEFSARGI